MRVLSAFLRGCVLVCWLFATSPVAAELLDMGDFTRDTESGLDWLDVPITAGLSPNDILNDELGLMSAGWRYATGSELCGLFNAGVELPPVPPFGTTYLPDCPDEYQVGWNGEVGVVTKLIAKASFDPLNTTAFICGPEIMMRFTIKELEAAGVGEESIFVSLERNMKCGVGLCGHCQFGPEFLCKDGPVFPYGHVKNLLLSREA